MKKLMLLTFALYAAACGGGAGGSCDYTETTGVCTVTHVSTSTDGSDPTTFNFAPTGSSTTSGTGDFENGSEDANQACSAGAGLTAGSSHACTMHTSKSGTCTPMFFSIDGFDAATTTGCH